MTKLIAVGMRGTDIVKAGLWLPEPFRLDEIVEAHAKQRLGRGLALPTHHGANTRQGLQRLSPDCPQFDGKRALIRFHGRGRYSFIDKPKLVDAAERYGTTLTTRDRLLIPVEDDGVADEITNVDIGIYAQNLAMDWFRRQGWHVTETSVHSAYDFIVRNPDRITFWLVESKGTTGDVGTIRLTANEQLVMRAHSAHYCLAVTHSIQRIMGGLNGGVLLITKPPDIDKVWAFPPVIELKFRKEFAHVAHV